MSPYLGVASKRPDFTPDPSEVAAILEIDASDLYNPTCLQNQLITLRGGYRIETPCFYINGRVIWGATAMIVSEFMEIIEAI